MGSMHPHVSSRSAEASLSCFSMIGGDFGRPPHTPSKFPLSFPLSLSPSLPPPLSLFRPTRATPNQRHTAVTYEDSAEYDYSKGQPSRTCQRLLLYVRTRGRRLRGTILRNVRTRNGNHIALRTHRTIDLLGAPWPCGRNPHNPGKPPSF